MDTRKEFPPGRSVSLFNATWEFLWRLATLPTLINEPDKEYLREQLVPKNRHAFQLYGYCSEWMCATAAILFFRGW